MPYHSVYDTKSSGIDTTWALPPKWRKRQLRSYIFLSFLFLVSPLSAVREDGWSATTAIKSRHPGLIDGYRGAPPILRTRLVILARRTAGTAFALMKKSKVGWVECNDTHQVPAAWIDRWVSRSSTHPTNEAGDPGEKDCRDCLCSHEKKNNFSLRK